MARPIATTATIAPFLRGANLSVRWSFRGCKYRTPTLAKVDAVHIAKNGYVKNTQVDYLTTNDAIAAATDRLEQATTILLNSGDIPVKPNAEQRLKAEQRMNAEYTRLTGDAVAAGVAVEAVEKRKVYKKEQNRKIDTVFLLPALDEEIVELRAQLATKIRERDNMRKELGMYFDDILIKYMADYAVRDGITTMEPSTLRSHKSFIETLKQFESDTKIQDVDEAWLIRFQDWLITTPSKKPVYSTWKDGKRQRGEILRWIEGKTRKNNTVETYLTKVKSCLAYYQQRPELLPDGVVISDQYKRFEFKLMGKDDNVVSLEEFELFQLLNFNDFAMREQERAVDILLFLCATSLRYSDLRKVVPITIKNGEIVLIAQKTKKHSIKVNIPLNPISSHILAKYQNDMNNCKMAYQRVKQRITEVLNHNNGQTFPSFQMMETVTNYSGKVDAGCVDKRANLIASHSGRRTFINICLDYNVPVNKIIGMTGHLDVQTLMIYANKRKDVKKHMNNIFQLPEYEQQDYTSPLLLTEAVEVS